jgi:hypothetical protein
MTSLYEQLMESKGAPRAAPSKATQIGKAPMNLRSAMQKYARGGDVKNFSSSNVSLDNYSSYSAKQNHEYVNIPGVGDNILMFWDYPNKRVVVSDEGYWNKDAPVGEKLKRAVDWAHNQGYQAGVVVSPYSSDRFGDGVTTTAGGQPRKTPGATDQQLRDYIDAADFVVTDPYIVSQATATPEMQDNFANFTKNVGDYANAKGKDSWLFLQGFGTKDVDPKIVEDYNNRLATENAGRYNDVSFFNLSDFGFAPGESVETFGDTIYQLNTKGAVDAATQAAQPFKMAEKTGLDLPADWNNYNSKDKIDWFNEKNVSPDTLAQSGVAQENINWMANNGYTGNTAQQQPQRMMAQAQPQEMTGIAALGGEQGYTGYQTGDSGVPDDNLINIEGYPVDSNGQRLDNPYSSGYGGGFPEPTPENGYNQPYVPPYTGPQDVASQAPQMPVTSPAQVAPAAPDYSRAYSALGGQESVQGLRNQFLQMGLDENTIGSMFSQYYAPEQTAQQPVQQMARGGMAQDPRMQALRQYAGRQPPRDKNAEFMNIIASLKAK